MRSGLSLVEVAVVIAILAIIAALLLPAVQAARESARRTGCTSNMRQLALAVHQYEVQHGACPPGASANGFSYLTALLPYFEQAPLFSWIVAQAKDPTDLKIEEKQLRINAFKCPSDGVSMARPSASNYSGTIGYHTVGRGCEGMFINESLGWAGHVDRGRCIRFSEVTDGSAQTALVSEILVSDFERGPRFRTNWSTAETFDPDAYDAFLQACLDQQYATSSSGAAWGSPRGLLWLQGGAGATLYTHDFTPNNLSCMNGSSIQYGAHTATSNHPGGVMVVFVDGHAQFVSSTIDVPTWRSMSTRAGQEASVFLP
jgi:prepilin-type N-terminal cleavage/methylation domain-containing protein/prepilin-type processing-associated H-X9-DG protein